MDTVYIQLNGLICRSEVAVITNTEISCVSLHVTLFGAKFCRILSLKYALC